MVGTHWAVLAGKPHLQEEQRVGPQSLLGDRSGQLVARRLRVFGQHSSSEMPRSPHDGAQQVRRGLLDQPIILLQ